MIIDCDTCEVRPNACGECVIGVLLGVPEVPRRAAADPSRVATVQLDAPERRALDMLADQGLIPRLRLVTTSRAPEPDIRPRDARDVG